MKKIILLICLFIIGNASAQHYRGDYNEWTLEFNAGVNKPYQTMSSGFGTANPNLFHIDLGTRYTINPYIGLKADISYDSFANKKGSPKFNSDYYRFSVQAVADLGYTFGLYERPDPFGVLFHAGTGLSVLESDINKHTDKMVNFIFGFTGTIEISNNITLSGDVSSLSHVRQEMTFDGRTQNMSLNILNANLVTTSIGIIYFFRE